MFQAPCALEFLWIYHSAARSRNFGFCLDQPQLFLSPPILQLLFAGDGLMHIVETFPIDQHGRRRRRRRIPRPLVSCAGRRGDGDCLSCRCRAPGGSCSASCTRSSDVRAACTIHPLSSRAEHRFREAEPMRSRGTLCFSLDCVLSAQVGSVMVVTPLCGQWPNARSLHFARCASLRSG